MEATSVENASRLLAALAERIALDDEGCWIWIGYVSGRYGRLGTRLSSERWAHRLSYMLHVGAIPDGYDVDHLCRVTLCVNPDHLEAVTPEENLRRQAAAITHCKQGHEYTEANTYRRPDAPHQRDCKECRRASVRRAYRKRPKPPPATVCKNGHPMSGDNLVEKSGVRVCRACRRLAAQASNAKRRVAAA